MTIRIGDEAPDFTADTTQGKIKFHDWIGNGWAILFSHPKDFTPVCTTELGYMARLKPDFDKRNTKVIGLSIDPVADHNRWLKDIEETQNGKVDYPRIGDAELTVAKLYDMIHPNASAGPRTAADNATIRPSSSSARQEGEGDADLPDDRGPQLRRVLRLLDSLQTSAKHSVATPVNWKPGEKVIIPASVSDEDAKKKFPQGFKTPAVPEDGGPAMRIAATAIALAALPLAVLAAGPIYPEVSRANADIEAGLKEAKADHKRVLVDFGGNWCTDCKVLDINFKKPENEALLKDHYVLVHVNVGEKRIDENLDIGERYGIPLKKGVPALVVLDGDGRSCTRRRKANSGTCATWRRSR